MDNNEKFETINDLYKKVLPALQTRISELKREGINYINEIDIWKYCMNNIWKSKKDLRMYELVSDILNVDRLCLEKYIKNDIVNYKNMIESVDDER